LTIKFVRIGTLKIAISEHLHYNHAILRSCDHAIMLSYLLSLRSRQSREKQSLPFTTDLTDLIARPCALCSLLPAPCSLPLNFLLRQSLPSLTTESAGLWRPKPWRRPLAKKVVAEIGPSLSVEYVSYSVLLLEDPF